MDHEKLITEGIDNTEAATEFI